MTILPSTTAVRSITTAVVSDSCSKQSPPISQRSHQQQEQQQQPSSLTRRWGLSRHKSSGSSSKATIPLSCSHVKDGNSSDTHPSSSIEDSINEPLMEQQLHSSSLPPLLNRRGNKNSQYQQQQQQEYTSSLLDYGLPTTSMPEVKLSNDLIPDHVLASPALPSSQQRVKATAAAFASNSSHSNATTIRNHRHGSGISGSKSINSTHNSNGSITNKTIPSSTHVSSTNGTTNGRNVMRSKSADKFPMPSHKSFSPERVPIKSHDRSHQVQKAVQQNFRSNVCVVETNNNLNYQNNQNMQNNPVEENIKNDQYEDDGIHMMEDFEDMIIECDDGSDSSFGDITYDGSIVDDEYYINRNRSHQQQQSSQQRGGNGFGNGASRNAGWSNNGNQMRNDYKQRSNNTIPLSSAGVPHPVVPDRTAPRYNSNQRINNRDLLSRDKQQQNYYHPQQQQPYNMDVPPTRLHVPSPQVPGGHFIRNASNTIGSSIGSGLVDEDIDEQEMALIELAMERSLKDCSSVASSKLSKATYRSLTSTGSGCTTTCGGGSGGGGGSTSLDGTGGHLSHSHRGVHHHHNHHNSRSGTVLVDKNGVRFMWKREGKKWQKVPVAGSDESNLHAIDEEKEPVVTIATRTTTGSTIDDTIGLTANGVKQKDTTYVKYVGRDTTTLGNDNSSYQPHQRPIQNRPKSNSFDDSWSHLTSPKSISINSNTKSTVASINNMNCLSPKHLERIEQDMLDEALQRSIECMHNSSSQSTAISSIHMNSPYRSPSSNPQWKPLERSSSLQSNPSNPNSLKPISSSCSYTNEFRYVPSHHQQQQQQHHVRGYPGHTNGKNMGGMAAPPLFGGNLSARRLDDLDYSDGEEEPYTSTATSNNVRQERVMQHNHQVDQSSDISYESSKSGGGDASRSQQTPNGSYTSANGSHHGKGSSAQSYVIPEQVAHIRQQQQIPDVYGNARFANAGCHLAMIGGRRPSNRAILKGIDYEEDEEELMAEHLEPRPFRRSSMSRHVSMSSLSANSRRRNSMDNTSDHQLHHSGEIAGYNNAGVKLVWKRGPNNVWGKYPEENEDEKRRLTLEAEEERMIQEALQQSLIDEEIRRSRFL